MQLQSLITYFETILPLNTEEVKLLEQTFTEKSFKKGQMVLEEDQVCDDMLFVTEGYLRLFVNKDIEEITSVIAGPDEFITSLSGFLTRKPSGECIQAITPVAAFSISYANLQVLYKNAPRFERIGRIIVENYYVKKDQRVLSFIRDTAEERYLDMLAYRPDYFRNVPQHYIASALGISPETLSRIRSRKIS